jgi:hypothetical protein
VFITIGPRHRLTDGLAGDKKETYGQFRCRHTYGVAIPVEKEMFRADTRIVATNRSGLKSGGGRCAVEVSVPVDLVHKDRVAPLDRMGESAGRRDGDVHIRRVNKYGSSRKSVPDCSKKKR